MFIHSEGPGQQFFVLTEDVTNGRTLTLFQHLDLNLAMAFVQGRIEGKDSTEEYPTLEIVSGYRRGHLATSFVATHTSTNTFRLGKKLPLGEDKFEGVEALLKHCWRNAPHGHAFMVAIRLDFGFYAFDTRDDAAMELYWGESHQE